MIKKVAVGALKPGMYIHDLNCGWLKHPFLSNSFLIRDQATIETIRALGLREVLVDSERSEAEGASVEEAVAVSRGGQREATEQLQAELDRRQVGAPVRRAHVDVDIELQRAHKIQSEAVHVVEDVMHDARLGRQIETGKVEPVVERMVDSVFRNPNAMLSLSRIRQRDRYTFEHSIGVSVLLIAFARAQGLEDELIRQLGIGGLLHDIGKTRVPDAILNKPGRLTEEEFAVMRGHVDHGVAILEQTSGISEVALRVTAEHHERHDGSGYSRGLKGEAISLYGQMASVVDVYDAITADRCYHKGEHPMLVLRKLLDWSKSHFREEVVHHFIQCVGIYPAGTLVRMESGRLALVVEPGEKILYPIIKIFFNSHTRSYITPQVVDLANPGRCEDHIEGYEDPARWNFPLDRLIG